jgi:hypothetical protein
VHCTPDDSKESVNRLTSADHVREPIPAHHEYSSSSLILLAVFRYHLAIHCIFSQRPLLPSSLTKCTPGCTRCSLSALPRILGGTIRCFAVAHHENVSE